MWSQMNIYTKHQHFVYLFNGAVAPSVPLLRVQADENPLSQEQRSPHDHVPDRPLSSVMKNEVKRH